MERVIIGERTKQFNEWSFREKRTQLEAENDALIRVKIRYAELLEDFDAYGNEIYDSMIKKKIPRMILYYGVGHPYSTRQATFDYPTIVPVKGDKGIDAIDRYLSYIEDEQRFLKLMPEGYAVRTLWRYDANYKKQYYNISAVVLRNFLACSMIQKDPFSPVTALDYEALQTKFRFCSISEIRGVLNKTLGEETQDLYYGRTRILLYYAHELTEYAKDIYSALLHGGMGDIIVF